MKYPTKKRTLILLSQGEKKYKEIGFAQVDEPQPHWREVARLTNAVIESWATVSERRGNLFRLIFKKKPLWGLALSVAIDANKYDQIYAIDEDCGFRVGLLLRARCWEGRLVCLIHHLSPSRRKIVKLLINKPLKHCFTYTELQKNELLNAGININNVSCDPIPTDVSFFKPNEQLIKDNRIVAIGAAARDYETLFKAAPQINARIEVFGHGYSGANAAKLAAHDLPNNVFLMPHISVSELRTRMATAFAAVLPLYPVNYAAGATVLIEAMSVGIPVVVTKIPGIADYLEKANPGPSVPTSDPTSLAQSLSKLLQDQTTATKIGIANRNWAVTHAKIEDFALRVSMALSGNPVKSPQWD